ncbi:non-ribosomal peptide synthetase, partial [Flavitalea flava]
LNAIQQWIGIAGDLFDSILVFENYPVSKVIASRPWALKMEDINLVEQINYPLGITIIAAEEIRVRFGYNTRLLDKEQVGRITGHFMQVLQQICDSRSDIRVRDLQMLTGEERDQLLVGFNDTGTCHPAAGTIIDLFIEQVRRTPDAAAVIFGEESLSYRELDERSNRLGHYLRGKGVKEETLVAICIERSLEMLVGILGILKAGGAYVPIDPEYPEDRIAYMLEDTGALVVISSRVCGSRIPEGENRKVIVVEDQRAAIDREPESLPQTALGPDHLAYVIYTSGSTGQPKGVMIEHRSVFTFLKWCQKEFSSDPVEIIYAGTSICFDLSIFELFYSWSAGKCCRILESGLFIGKHILTDKFILLNTVPGIIRHLQQEEIDLMNVTVINMAGEPIPVEVQENLDMENMSVRNLYGPSEDTTYSTVCRLKKGYSSSIGKPIDHTHIYIVNDQGQLCPAGCTGEICIAGAGLSRGYLNRPFLTTEKFIANPFSNVPGDRMYRTGDLGRWEAGGDIVYLGRIDEQVKIRGYRVEPGEIERVLLQSPEVNRAIVIGWKKEGNPTRIAAYVVAEGRFDKEAIGNYLGTKLPAYMLPASIIELKEIPLTPNGKVDKKALPDPFTENLTGEVKMGPRNEVEEKLVDIWKDLLRIGQIGVYDNFFEAGGHSLLATRLVSAIRKCFLVNIPIRILFEFNTINDLGKYIELELSGNLKKEEDPALYDVINI